MERQEIACREYKGRLWSPTTGILLLVRLLLLTNSEDLGNPA